MDVKYCVYKYVCNGEIIYIGKTDSSLKNRVKCHAREEKFQQYLSQCQVFYMVANNFLETDVYEKILINKYQPILNEQNKIGKKISRVSIQEKWELYKDNIWKDNIDQEEMKSFLEFYQEYINNNKIKINMEEDIFSIIDSYIKEEKKRLFDKKQAKERNLLYFKTSNLSKFLLQYKTYSLTKTVSFFVEEENYATYCGPVYRIIYNRLEKQYTIYYDPKESFIFCYLYKEGYRRRQPAIINLKNKVINPEEIT